MLVAESNGQLLSEKFSLKTFQWEPPPPYRDRLSEILSDLQSADRRLPSWQSRLTTWKLKLIFFEFQFF